LCGTHLDEYGKHKLSRIRENAHRMGMLIDDILRFSRLGRTAVIPGKVDMNALVREIIADIQNTTGTDSVHFTVHSLPEAWCDRALMHQVWENLLSNAVKFTGHRQERRVEIGAFEEAGEIVYYVKDNGSGLIWSTTTSSLVYSSACTAWRSSPAPAWASPSCGVW
jgi:two-component system, chemotaxis family, sensor kinase Cph1